MSMMTIYPHLWVSDHDLGFVFVAMLSGQGCDINGIVHDVMFLQRPLLDSSLSADGEVESTMPLFESLAEDDS